MMTQKIVPTIEKEGEFIDFYLVELKPKTKVFDVNVKGQDITLGQIKWYAQWRQYSFFPIGDTVFEKTCMQEITDFLIDINKKHRSNK